MGLKAMGAVLSKELLSRMRNWRSLLTITLYLATLAVIGVGTMRYLRDEGKNTGLEAASIGPQVFGALASFELVMLVFITPALTAGAIAGEKERQTYDLLLTTRLSSFSIVIGKLIMSLAYVLLLLFLSLPLFAMAFLFGGINPGQLLLTSLILSVTALTIGSLSLLVSTMIRKVQIATVVAYLVSFGLVLGSGLFANLLVDTPAVSSSNANNNNPGQPVNPAAVFFQAPPDPHPLAYLSPLASLSTVVTNPFGAATQNPFLDLPNGLPKEYFNRSFYSNTSNRGPYPPGTYIPTHFYSLPSIWPVQLGIYGVIIVVSLGLAVLLVRPRRWWPRRWRFSMRRRSRPAKASI